MNDKPTSRKIAIFEDLDLYSHIGKRYNSTITMMSITTVSISITMNIIYMNKLIS